MSDEQIEGYTRISTVLSPFSGMGAIPPAILKAACDRGDAVHKAINGILEGFGEPDKDFEHMGYVDSFRKWWNNQPVYKTEDRLFDHDLKLTGQYDLIYQDKADLVLVDFKTSAKEGKTWALQGSAYDHLIRLTGLQISRIEFVQVMKDGSSPEIFVYKPDWTMFLKVFEVYQMFFKTKKHFPEDL